MGGHGPGGRYKGHYRPETLILTSAEYDHADLYPTPEALFETFAKLIGLLPASGLLVACGDASVERVVLDGAGPSFCSGGDLAEFGTLPDPATAHLVRLTRSPARLLAELGPRLEVRLHGACIGAGIEMAAFAGRVIAHIDAVISLPEVGLGLIPGAGGTVSLPRRIGRHRTAELALGGGPIDAPTAQKWGLVDAIDP